MSHGPCLLVQLPSSALPLPASRRLANGGPLGLIETKINKGKI